jgi:glutaredoxin-like protein NrdH
MTDTHIVRVYTAPGCQPCSLTKRHLERRGIAYEEISLADDERDRAAVRALGFTSAPVVCAATRDGEQTWGGYRPDMIDALAAVVGAERN